MANDFYYCLRVSCLLVRDNNTMQSVCITPRGVQTDMIMLTLLIVIGIIATPAIMILLLIALPLITNRIKK